MNLLLKGLAALVLSFTLSYGLVSVSEYFTGTSLVGLVAALVSGLWFNSRVLSNW